MVQEREAIWSRPGLDPTPKPLVAHKRAAEDAGTRWPARAEHRLQETGQSVGTRKTRVRTPAGPLPARLTVCYGGSAGRTQTRWRDLPPGRSPLPTSPISGQTPRFCGYPAAARRLISSGAERGPTKGGLGPSARGVSLEKPGRVIIYITPLIKILRANYSDPSAFPGTGDEDLRFPRGLLLPVSRGAHICLLEHSAALFPLPELDLGPCFSSSPGCQSLWCLIPEAGGGPPPVTPS